MKSKIPIGIFWLGLCPPLAAQVPANSRVQEVVVVFKTHFDIGYTELADHVVNRYRTSMIDKALSLMDASRSRPRENQFSWTVPGWPLQQILWDSQTPRRRERVMEALREGRLVFHALPFTTHTESLDLEDLVRGLGFSSRLARELGQPLPRDAKMTDVPEHTWLMPTLLARAGVEFLHIGCNAASTPPDVPDLFWWEGPDGSRVLTMNSGKAYGTGLIAPASWPYETWLALMMTGDNQGPPAPETITRLLDQAKRQLPGVRVRFGRLSDFADAIKKENARIPVVRGDMPDTWIHGIMSLPVETAFVRNARPQIGAAEGLGTLLRCWGVDTDPAARDIARAYEESLLYGEHTWGYNSAYFGHRYGQEWREARAAGHYQPYERSWDDHRAYARNAAAAASSILELKISTLAQSVSVDGPRVVVYNPLPWRRDGIASGIFGDFPALKEAASGEVLPVSRKRGERQFQFIARDLPPMGYRTYIPLKEDSKRPGGELAAGGNVIENDFLRVTLDASRGGVRSVVEKSTGRELVDASSPYALGQYLYERFDAGRVASFLSSYLSNPEVAKTWGANDFGKPNLPAGANYVAAAVRNCTAGVTSDGVVAEALLKCAPDGALRDLTVLRVRLYRGQPFLELGWGISGKTEDPWPEAGWLALPLRAPNPTFRLGRVGSIVDAEKETVRNSNHDQFCLNTGIWVKGSDQKGAVACPIDSPVVSLGAPGGWRFTGTLRAPSSSVFVNLFNNQWSTNFALWSGGAWSSRIRVWAVEGESDLKLITNSWEARQPAVAAYADGPKGPLPSTSSGVELSMPGVLVTAFGPNPDGEGTLLRLWEQAGGRGQCHVRLPQGLSAKMVQTVDLRGRPVGKPLPVTAGAISLNLEPFAPVSLLLLRGD